MTEGLDEEDEELRFGDLICTLEPPPNDNEWYYQHEVQLRLDCMD